MSRKPPKPGRKPRFSMLRTFALADFITIGNAAAGTGAIFLCLAYVAERDRAQLWAAFVLLPIALVCDVADGSVARWRRKHSPIGADLDSLADVISFGVAPAVLGFTLGMRGFWDSLVLVYFVACGMSRLARYNVTAAQMSDASGKVKYYEGTPIPTSLLLVLVLGVAFGMGAVGDALWLGVLHLGPYELHPLVLMFGVSGTLMASATIHIPKP
jgi:CDP-diacylglycerol--serine O-phosphatidyltransferase